MNIEWSKIEKVLNGTASKEEVALLNKWLAENPDKKEYFEKIEKYYSDPEAGCAENNLKRKSRHSADNIILKNRSLRVILRTASAGAVAAALIAITILLYNPFLKENIVAETITTSEVKTVKIFKDSGEEISIENFETQGASIDSTHKTLTYNEELQVSIDDSIEYYTISVPLERDFTLTLCDGTKIILNAGSQLRYPNRFREGESRKVYLSGEGYFEVKHSDKQRFIVNLENMNVVVYGTKFNINSHFKNTETVLVEGSIAIDVNGCETMIKPNERALVSKQGEGIVVERVNTDKYISWTTGYFSFDGEKLSHIAAVLTQWYGCNIEIENSKIADEILSCHVDKNSSIEDILKAIMNTNKVKYRRVGDKYIFW